MVYVNILNDDQKRLIYRSWHRGTREMDILLGRFADAHVPTLDARGVDDYDRLLACEDPDLWDYYTGKTPIPVEDDTPVMRAFLGFNVVE